MNDLAGIPTLASDQLDGTSLGWVLKSRNAGERQPKLAVLTQFPRCPLGTNGSWITDPAEMWQNNWCEFVDR